MTESSDDSPGRVFGPEDLNQPIYEQNDLDQLAESLDCSQLSPEQIRQVERAALNYFFIAELESAPRSNDDQRRFMPGRAERRKALREVAKFARKLSDALQDRTITFLIGDDRLPPPSAKALDDLAVAAERFADRIPKTQADPEEARLTFIRDLADIYERVSGLPATRSHDGISGIDTGRFLNFVQVALRPVNPDALKGVEHVVREVANERRGSRGS